MGDLLIAALCGSFTSLAVVYPTEVYKRALHLNTQKVVRSSGMEIAKGLFPFGFYSGFLSCAMGVVPKNAFPLFAYGPTKEWWTQHLGDGGMSSLLTGVSLSSLVTIATSPTENLSLRKSNFPNDSVGRWFVEGGWKKVYVGFSGFLMMDFIRVGVKFGIYSEILRMVKDRDIPMAYAWSGAAASSLVAMFTNPIDVAHTKFRSDYTAKMYGGSFFKAVTTTKLRDLYCGFPIRALRGIPGGFVMFGTYEYMLQLLHNSKS